MKATVIKLFQDKISKQYYHIGDKVEFADKTRFENLVSRKLIVADVVEEKPTKSATKKPTTKKEAKDDNTRKMQKSIED